MTANINHRVFIEGQPQLKELDEKRKMASEVLKRVDQLIKAKDLQRALLETASAKMIDPQNAYAFALEERIRGLIAEQSKTQRQKEQIKSQPELVINAGREGDKKSLPQVSVVLPQNINQIALSVTSTVPHVQQSNIPTAG